jgi:hypothetical protein
MAVWPALWARSDPETKAQQVNNAQNTVLPFVVFSWFISDRDLP